MITITKENFSQHVSEATGSLLEMAKISSWNKISDNCRYIITEYNFDTDCVSKRLYYKDALAMLLPLSDVLSQLIKRYKEIYDLNLYVYAARSKFTIIEFQICPKLLLEEDYRATVVDNPPMIHCKVAIPPYKNFPKSRSDNSDQNKFDINWQHNTISHRWNMFLLRLRHKLLKA